MAYQQACYLQSELLIVSSEFDLKEFDIISTYQPEDLAPLSAIAHQAEDYIRAEIQNHSIILEEYETLDAFLQKN